MADRPLAYDTYEALAESYAARVDTKPHNAYYDRPAIFSLAPPLQGKTVLDAGCGPGAYAERLLGQGATVVCVDASPKMLGFARARLGDRVRFHEADLGKPLDFLADEAFDLVVSPLTLDYIPNWIDVFREFRRVLRPGGALIFSMEHPLSDYLAVRMRIYFEREVISGTWSGFGEQRVKVSAYRRSMSEVINTLIEAGFAIDRMLEPRPTEEFKEADRKDYEYLSIRPGFLCVRAVKV
jgi:SAM-dependent methyltransferase